MQLNKHSQSSLNLNGFEDPSLSSHIQTIQKQRKNLPRLKYSLTCIAGTIAYNNSNRHYNISVISRPKNFKLIVQLLVNFQDPKILEESLWILNVLLNEGNDLTVQEENQIMHSISYVKVNNEVEKGFINDRLVQQILNLTYKLKTKNQLCQFIATLMSQKMTAVQAKRFLVQLKKQQLKNLAIQDLIKIGMKFKTNVLLMNQILNLIFEKVFAGKNQSEITKLVQFLPKIVQENIDEETISYKCLQIYKIVQKYSRTPIDPVISRYLQSLLKPKKDLLLPLKRQFVTTEKDFIKIVQFGTEFQIYHLLVVDYILRNGYGGRQNWKAALLQSQQKKNLKLKEICLKLGQQEKRSNKQAKYKITESDELQFMQILPIQTLSFPSSMLQKLLSQPSISNSLHMIKNLCFYKKQPELLLTIHRISLKQKQFHLVQQIQKLVKQSFNEKFLYDQLKNVTKVKHKIVLKGQLYFIWLPILFKDENLLKNLENQLIQIMGYDSIEIEDKFYVMEFLIENKMVKVVSKFLLYLNRQLEAISSIEQQAKKDAEALLSQIKFYLKKWVLKFKDNAEIFELYQNHLGSHLQRTTELLFSKIVEFKSQTVTTLLFELQKWDFYGQNWRQPYRWILTALEEISQQNSLYTLDCIQLFEMCVQNIPIDSIPWNVKERFMKLIKKNWSRLESEHLFAIERIIQILWQDHQYPILKDLVQIKPITQLIEQQRKFNTKNQYFFESEHPTSNYLINLQMSHFFGVLSQDEFVRYILQLYDKRFSEVKRFTQKNVISLMNFIIWIYQYSEQDMDKGLSDMILAFLSYKAQGANVISSYNIRRKCIQIVAVVSHSINLLKLPIKELLQTYIGEPSVMKNLNEIIQTIIQSKASFISQLGLQTIIESIMISLITCQNLDLIEEYIEFIEAVCYIQNSSYSVLFQNSVSILYQVLKIEFKIVEKYRKNLIQFVLHILKHYDFQVEDSLLWFLMNKYFIQEKIQVTILEYILLGIEANPQYKLQYSNQKLLFRLIMHHNQNTDLVSMVQQILNSTKKQTDVVFVTSQPQTEKKPQSKKLESKIEPQQQFVQQFKRQNFHRCQELLSQIRNPFITLTKDEIKLFLIGKDLYLFENLLSFLVKNPTIRNQVLGIQQFYIRTQCLPYIFKLGVGLIWSSQFLEKTKLTSFNENKLAFQIQPNPIDQLVRKTVMNLFCSPNVKRNIVFLLKSLKNSKQQFQLLAFYSKCVPNSSSKVFFDIITQLQLQNNLELLKLHIPQKIERLSQAPCQSLLYHLFVHIQNSFLLSSSELQNTENYINQIVQMICPHELIKNLPVAHQFFLNLSTKLQKNIVSQNLISLLQEVCYRYLIIFEAGQTNSSCKPIDIKQPQCIGIISALLFLYKNNVNIYTGLSSNLLNSLENKLCQNQIVNQAYEFLLKQKSTVSLKDSNVKKSQNVSALTETLKQKKQGQPKSQTVTIVFAKQDPKNKQDSPSGQKINEVNDAFKKSKQLEEYLSVVPRQVKALEQKNLKEKEQGLSPTKNQQSIEMKMGLTEEQSLLRPKQDGFDEKKFYERVPSQEPKRLISQKQRKQILQSIKSKQGEQISIATLKQHAKFISSLFDYQSSTKEELEQLLKSIDNITSTVNEHHYYVKKLIELEVTFKLIKLFKRKDQFIPKQLSHLSDLFQAKLLKLHHAMSIKKEKKTIVFDDELTIEFFKLIVKKSININQSREENTVIIEIVNHCIKSIDSFFKQGLISMFIELLKKDLNSEDVLKFFCKIQLSKYLIFEIYQRGLLNKFADVFHFKKQVLSTIIFNLWIRLAGKICNTPVIQQKYIEKQIHKLVWQRHNQISTNDIQCKKNISFFFAYMGRRNQKVFQYLAENQILQKLLAALKNQQCEELYMLFYHIILDNQNALEYSFRIKYHLHLLEKLSKPGDKPNSKYFYKSLGQIMSSKQHQALFFKQNVVQKLVKEYEVKSEPSIYQCLLDFIVTLENDKEFEELKKQNFWSCLSLFEYKLSSEATYAYILQIFLVMIKKGRIKQFNTAQVRGKVTLKAQYSINLEGKQLAIRLITALSLKTKQCYITERCIRLLSSLVGFKVTSTQLDIMEDVLDVEGMLQNFEFFSFCHDYEITQNICNRFKSFNESQLLSALKILNILGTQSKNNKILRDRLLMPVMEILLNEDNRLTKPLVQEWLFKTILIIVSFRQNNEVVQKLQLGTFMIKILDKILKKDQTSRKAILDEYVTIIEICRQNNMIPLIELEKILEQLNKKNIDNQVSRVSQIKQSLQGQVANQSNEIFGKMFEGIHVKMYKNDGSSSDLILFLTEDKLELNCVTEKGQPVKQKWRLVLSQIQEINLFNDEKQYQNSAFARSAGLFSRAPDRKLCLSAKSKNNEFNILFTRKQEKEAWKKYIEFAIQSSKKILKQFK